jgi:hypothetical protein
MLKKVLLVGAVIGLCLSVFITYSNVSLFATSSDLRNQNLALGGAATGSITPQRVTRVNVANCTCPPGKPKVFAIGGQGSKQETDSSKFFQYVQANYGTQADIQNEGIISTGFDAPTEETLDKIATHISSYIINVGGPVKIWSYSLGALYTPYIVDLVKAKLKTAGVTCYNLDMILIDPPFKGGWDVPSCTVSVLGVCNVKVFDFLNKWSERVRTNPGLVNLSEGKVITSTDGSLVPNADRHYPFGKTSPDAVWALGKIKSSLDASLLNLCVAVKVLNADGVPAYAGSAKYTKTNPNVSAYAVAIKDVKSTSAHSPLANYTNKNGEAVFVNLKAGEKYRINAVIYDSQTLDAVPVAQEISPTATNRNYTIRLGPALSSSWYPANELREKTTALYKAFKPPALAYSVEKDQIMSCAYYQGKTCSFPSPNYSSDYPYQISTTHKTLERAGRVCLDGLGYYATTACINNKMVQLERTQVLPDVKVEANITPSASCLSPETNTGNAATFTVRVPQLGPNNLNDGLRNYKDYAYAVALVVDGKVVVEKQGWKEPRGAITYRFDDYLNRAATTHDVYAVVSVHTSTSFNKTNTVLSSESNHVKVRVGHDACVVAKILMPGCTLNGGQPFPEINVHLNSTILYDLSKNGSSAVSSTCSISSIQVIQPDVLKQMGITLKVGNQSPGGVRTFSSDTIAPTGITNIANTLYKKYFWLFLLKGNAPAATASQNTTRGSSYRPSAVTPNAVSDTSEIEGFGTGSGSSAGQGSGVGSGS